MTIWPMREGARRAKKPPSRGMALAVAVAAGSFLTGCGMGVDAAPHVVSNKDVPFALLGPAPPTTGPAATGEYVTLYLAGPDRLAAVSLELPSPVTFAEVLGALDRGPTASQAGAGLESPLSTAAPLTFVGVQSTTVTIDISSGFTKLSEQDQILAMAQLVYTLTALPDVDSVDVRIGGRRANVPTGKGTLSGGPLARADYATLAPL